MKILFITPYIPSPLRPRPYHFIRQLAKRGHEIVLVVVRGQQDSPAAEEIRKYCRETYFFTVSPLRSAYNYLRAFPLRLPFQALQAWQPATVRFLRRLIDQGNFDLIHVEHLRAARYGLLRSHEMKTRKLPPVVWDSVDAAGLFQRETAEHGVQSWRRLLAGLEAERTELYEGWLMNQFAHVLVTSAQDQKWLISRQAPGPKPVDVDILPNGVDLEYFLPGTPNTQEPARVLLSGDMSYHGNVIMALYLVEEIMPLVWECLPETRVEIAGHAPTNAVLALTRDNRVSVTGTVADIRTNICQSTVAVAPLLFGLGIQNKVLEAMACAKPVVATPQAVGALPVTSGKQLIIADDAIKFARGIENILQDPNLQRSLGREGRLYVETHHPWPAAVDHLETVYAKVLERRGSAMKVQ